MELLQGTGQSREELLSPVMSQLLKQELAAPIPTSRAPGIGSLSQHSGIQSLSPSTQTS